MILSSKQVENRTNTVRTAAHLAVLTLFAVLLLFGQGRECGAFTNESLSYNDATFTFTGDCSIGKLPIYGDSDSLNGMYYKYGPEYFFEDFADYFMTDDMTLINFEGVLTESDEAVEKEFNIKGDPEFISILPVSGIDAVSFANNHNMDYGQQGFDDTIAAFESINLPWACDDVLGYFTTESGLTIGFVAVNEIWSEHEVIEPIMQSGIETLRSEGVDFVVACCHFGTQSHHVIDDYQAELAHKCIDWGADIVIGNHPHVLQGMEYYEGHYIAYSLGNLCFGANRAFSRQDPQDTVLLQTTYRFHADGTVDEPVVNLIPAVVSSHTSYNDYKPSLAEGERRDRILENMNTYCGYFNTAVDEDGHVTHE